MAKPAASMPEIIACSCSQQIFPEVNEAILSEAEFPARVAVAGIFLELDPPSLRRRRHEAAHDQQRASYAPIWAAWFPLSVRAWLGTRRFWAAYNPLHQRLGFLGNPMEVEARAAELRASDDDDDEKTPIESGPGFHSGSLT